MKSIKILVTIINNVNMKTSLVFLVFYQIIANLVPITLAQCQISVKAVNVTSRSLRLEWTQNWDCYIQDYELEAIHLTYEACPSMPIEAEKQQNVSIVQNEDNSAFISGLQPFSTYQINLQGLDNGGQTVKAQPLKVETRIDEPETRPESGSVHPFTKALQFTWEPLQPKVNKTVCQNQHGQIEGYYVELIGLEPWSSGLLQARNLSENTPTIYLQHLLPYTRYKLKVYSRNANGLYNKNMALELYGQTKTHKPKKPVETKANSWSSDTLDVRWQPQSPPTGLIEKYKVRYGPFSKADNMVWKSEVEVAINRSDCTSKLREQNFFCLHISNLEPNTTYAFEVQAFNANFSEPSDFSDTFEGTTDPLPPTSPPIPITVTTVRPLPPPQEAVHGAFSTQVVLIIVSLLVIMVLICVVAYLVYKVKMHKLAMIYEARTRQLQSDIPGGLMISPAAHHLNRSMHSVSVLGSYVPNESIANTTITTADWVSLHQNAVGYQIEEIQRRRLPEIPTSGGGGPREEDMYENASVDSPDLLREIQKEIPSVIVSTPLPSHSRPECEDVDGYLRPTFPEQPHSTPQAASFSQQIPAAASFPASTTSSTSMMLNAATLVHNATVIPTESYVSSVNLQQQFPARTISPTSSTESHPLISTRNTTK